MKSIAKIICGAVAMVWMLGAYAGTETAPAKPAGNGAMNGNGKPANGKKPVRARVHKVDKAKVETRMKQRAARTHARTEMAEKAVAERKAQAQQPQPKDTAK